MRALIFIFVYASFAFAARPMITDDARVVDRHSCQLETWGVYDRNMFEYYAIPACNMFLDTEVSMGVMMSNAFIPDTNPSEKFRTQQFIIGAKKIFNDLEEQGFSYGVALGNAYNFLYSQYKNEHFIYVPISFAFLENTFLVHSNVGYKLKRNENEPHIYHLGLGFERELSQRFWLLGEGIYERGSRAQFQVGIRIWLLQDKIQLDGTYGNAFSGGESFVSLGLRLLSDEWF
ncbi:hypothetical protein [Helicobacter marmotae]|uniref:Outer membrane beta-barrel protein n=1 Tax=Helicobacter marmotae TaxID=152490 RepID=A0A3D8I4C0_9HELI|nr:hypothetical protein [Helicobacter marmotae]RDU60003.1 hypothetical protein CQA63_04420 [Helicobacter marmotae]